MTIGTDVAQSGPYFPNGVVTSFPFGISISDPSDISVIWIAADGTESVIPPASYTVTISASEPGGTVVFGAAPSLPAAGSALWIVLDPEFEQQDRYSDEGPFNQSLLEGSLDRQARLSIWLKSRSNRALAAPFGEELGSLPTAANRAGRYLAFDAEGLPVLASGTGTDGDFLALPGGSAFVGFRQIGPVAADRNARDKLREVASLDDYILDSDPRIDGHPDASLAFARAAVQTTVIHGTPGKIYYVKDVVLDGRSFNGRGCVLRDAPGAKFGIELRGYLPELYDVTFQDQGNYVRTTTLASSAAGGASSVVVTNASGMAVGDVIFIDTDANEVRWQTYITSVAGATIGLRDALPSAAAAGKQVDAMLAAIRVGAASEWLIEDVLAINGRGVLLTMPPAGQISNKGTVRRLATEGARYFGWIKAGDTAGVKFHDVKLWCGYVETFNHVGTGGAGPFSFAKRVFLLRDVTVKVDGVPQAYGVDWEFASQTAIQFLTGRFPAVGATIAIEHFRDGYRGFVEDQRSTAIISGGHTYNSLEVLDAFVGVACFESELTEFVSLISDTCQYAALQLSACTDTLVFSGDTFLGYSGSSLKVFGSTAKCFSSLYTKRVPLSEQWLGALDDNIYSDGASDLRIAAAGWSGEFQNVVAAGGKFAVKGAAIYGGRNTANLTPGATSYLSPAGAFGSIGDAQQRLIDDSTLKKLRVDTNTAPGAGQSYTINVLLSGVQVGQVVLSGAGTFAGEAVLNAFGAQGTALDFQLIASAGASASARINAQVAAI